MKPRNCNEFNPGPVEHPELATSLLWDILPRLRSILHLSVPLSSPRKKGGEDPIVEPYIPFCPDNLKKPARQSRTDDQRRSNHNRVLSPCLLAFEISQIDSDLVVPYVPGNASIIDNWGISLTEQSFLNNAKSVLPVSGALRAHRWHQYNIASDRLCRQSGESTKSRQKESPPIFRRTCLAPLPRVT